MSVTQGLMTVNRGRAVRKFLIHPAFCYVGVCKTSVSVVSVLHELTLPKREVPLPRQPHLQPFPESLECS